MECPHYCLISSIKTTRIIYFDSFNLEKRCGNQQHCGVEKYDLII